MLTDYSDFTYQFEATPDFGYVTVTVPADETILVEASSMATMSAHMQMKSKLKGGLGRLLTGESLVINEFTAGGAEGEIGIAPAAPGDVKHVYLEGDDDLIYLQNSAYLASSTTVTSESKWQGLMKGFFSGSGMFLIRCFGKGDLWFNSFGGIIEIEVDGSYVVDTGHIVGFTGGLQYDVSSVGGYKSLFFSGEGLVCTFEGQGKVWVQTRKIPAFTQWVFPFRPVKSNN